jgi:DNA-binding NarL/FixJ family response regulator
MSEELVLRKPRYVLLEYSDTEIIVRIPYRTNVQLDGLHLTNRETEILDLVRAGLINKVIGHQLHISERAVKFHVSNLLVKFNVTERTKL